MQQGMKIASGSLHELSKPKFGDKAAASKWRSMICVSNLSSTCRVSIEFSLYFNFNLLLKIDATCSVNRIIKFGGNLIARKRLASTKIL